MSERWYPLRLVDGALWLTKHARLDPAGLVVTRRDPARTLSWDDAVRPMQTRGWFVFGTHGRSWGPAVGARVDGERDVAIAWFGMLAHHARVAVVNDLAGYLRDTPAARPGLADPQRVTALFRALKAGHWTLPHQPHEPLLERAYDLHWAVERALDATWPRRYAGRPVAGERLPDVADVIRHVRAEQHDRYTDDEIAERARRYLDIVPWPFSILAGGTQES